MKAKTQRQPTAAELAAQHVARWFDLLLETSDALCENAPGFDAAFEEVANALRARYGPIKAADEEATAREVCERDAGYLIGVQVGLRLRGRP